MVQILEFLLEIQVLEDFNGGSMDIMDESKKEEFFELVEEMKHISENLNRTVEEEKAWKTRLQFAMIRDLVWQAEALLKGDTATNDF